MQKGGLGAENIGLKDKCQENLISPSMIKGRKRNKNADDRNHSLRNPINHYALVVRIGFGVPPGIIPSRALDPITKMPKAKT